ncbi:MAG: rhomboid family intramembrane serine protease [Deferrisomatales bacterium]
MPQPSAILCPRCRKLINADEPSCPHCGLSRPGSRRHFALRSLGRLSEDNVLSYLLYLNVGMYLLSLVLAPSRVGLSANPFALLSPSDRSLLWLGATGTIPIDHFGRWWTLLAANYLHGSVLHIFFNMAAIHQLGPLVLREYGLHRTVVLYTLGGVLGFWVSYVAGVHLTIGASAALCALIGAMLYYGRSRGGAYGQAVFQQIWGWALGIFLFGLLVPGINNWGHGGGMAAGWLLGMALGYRERRRESRVHRVLSAGCVVATLGVLGWAVTTGFLARLL